MKVKILYIILVFLLVSCSDEIELPQDTSSDWPEFDYVEVDLGISMESLNGANAMSRSFEDEDDGYGIIHDVWVVQFNGTDTDSEIIGQPQFFSTTETGDRALTLEGTNNYKAMVKLAITDSPCNVAIFANCRNGDGDYRLASYSWALGQTLQDWMDKTYYATDQSKIFTKYSSGTPTGTTFPYDATYAIEANGITTLDKVDKSVTAISGTLKRNLAKVEFSLKVDPNCGVSVKDVMLCSVPQSCYFQTDRTLNESSDFMPPFVAFKEYTEVPTTYTDYHFNEAFHSVDGEYDKYIFYAPMNHRGTSSGNSHSISTGTDEKKKSSEAPNNATYLRVVATYKDPSNSEATEDLVTYRIYVGGDKTNDFNMDANSRYLYSLEIKGCPDPAEDPRCQIWNGVDFRDYEERPNCYILNPPMTGGTETREYKIPVSKVDMFWGDSQYGNSETYCLSDNRYWKAEVLWADEPIDATHAIDGVRPFEITKPTGIGKDDFFTVKVRAGYEGNVLVGIKIYNDAACTGDPISPNLWSWHLWCTYYNPDDMVTLNYKPTSGVINYPVTGGNVQRYGWTSTYYYRPYWKIADWNDPEKCTLFGNMFIMDRNLGASAPDELGMAYQYLRKDPFPYTKRSTLKTVYDENGNSFTLSSSAVAGDIDRQIFSAYYPDNYYRIVCTEEELANDYIWGDVKSATKAEAVTYQHKAEKTMFDPCPLGWVMPVTPTTGLDGVQHLLPLTSSGVKDPNVVSYMLYRDALGYHIGVTVPEELAKETSLGNNYGVIAHAYSGTGYISSNGGVNAIYHPTGAPRWWMIPSPNYEFGTGYQVRPVRYVTE